MTLFSLAPRENFHPVKTRRPRLNNFLLTCCNRSVTIQLHKTGGLGSARECQMPTYRVLCDGTLVPRAPRMQSCRPIVWKQEGFMCKPVLNSRAHRRQLLRVVGVHDTDGGYSD